MGPYQTRTTPSFRPNPCLEPNGQKHIVERRVYVDLSSIHIPGAQVSAAILGLAATPREAATNHIIDLAYRTNFPNLFELLCGNQEAGSNALTATLFGSVGQGRSRSFIDAATRAGFQNKHRGYPTIFERRPSRSEKCVDIAMATAIQEDAVSCRLAPAEQAVIIATCDGDFSRLVERLRDRGFRITIVGWSHSTSWELRKLATEYIALDDYIGLVSFRVTH